MQLEALHEHHVEELKHLEEEVKEHQVGSNPFMLPQSIIMDPWKLSWFSVSLWVFIIFFQFVRHWVDLNSLYYCTVSLELRQIFLIVNSGLNDWKSENVTFKIVEKLN